MLLGGVAGNEVQQHAYALFVGLLKQMVQIFIGSITGGCLLIIPDIVARVLKGGVETGIDPKGIAAQVPYVVQLPGDSLKIPDPIPVGILK